MDLSLFHPTGVVVKRHAPLNIFNGATRRLPCQFLEWTGWYSNNMKMRLLGHYRLFQIYKKSFPMVRAEFTMVENYILHYRSLHAVKYACARFFIFIFSFFSRAETFSHTSIEEANRTLLNKKPRILKEFLENADTDFAAALNQALSQIASLSFLSDESDQLVVHTPDPPPVINNILLNRFSMQNINNGNTYNVTYEQQPAKGKQKGVFSKRQILMFFDLLSRSGVPEKLNLDKPNKFPAIAELLQGLTGNSTDSWIQELQNHKGSDLYEFYAPGQANQLIVNLITISQLTRAAGLDTIAKAAEKKIVEIEQQKAKL